MTALIATGLIPAEDPGRQTAGATAAGDSSGSGYVPSSNPIVGEVGASVETLQPETESLREQAKVWRHRAEVTETIAAERGGAVEMLKVSAEAERLALWMLTTGTPQQSPGGGVSVRCPRTSIWMLLRELGEVDSSVVCSAEDTATSKASRPWAVVAAARCSWS